MAWPTKRSPIKIEIKRSSVQWWILVLGWRAKVFGWNGMMENDTNIGMFWHILSEIRPFIFKDQCSSMWVLNSYIYLAKTIVGWIINWNSRCTQWRENNYSLSKIGKLIRQKLVYVQAHFMNVSSRVAYRLSFNEHVLLNASHGSVTHWDIELVHKRDLLTQNRNWLLKRVNVLLLFPTFNFCLQWTISIFSFCSTHEIQF